MGQFTRKWPLAYIILTFYFSIFNTSYYIMSRFWAHALASTSDTPWGSNPPYLSAGKFILVGGERDPVPIDLFCSLILSATEIQQIIAYFLVVSRHLKGCIDI